MNYPIIAGEPNFILIGVSAVFGLLVIIMIYYIFISKNSKGSGGSRNRNSSYTQGGKSVNSITGITNPNITNPNDLSLPIVHPANYIPSTTAASLVNTTPQVYNIRNNIYTLDDAPAVCGVFGGNVATIDQLIAAHKGGADWCNVGWTKDGLAAYPIQYSTWKTLQEDTPAKRGMCGTPGINLARNDPNLLYGVNCYGVKPEPKGNEKIKQTLISDKQLAINAQIALLQQNMSSIGVSPFNQNNWSA